MLVQNGDRITAALQRLFAQPNDNANAVLQKVLERIDQRPQTVVVREGGGAGRVVLAGAAVAGLAVRLRGWPASAAALRAAAQTLNGAVKAVGARLEVVRETLSKRVDEVGEKVDDVGVEVGEVKAELEGSPRRHDAPPGPAGPHRARRPGFMWRRLRAHARVPADARRRRPAALHGREHQTPARSAARADRREPPRDDGGAAGGSPTRLA